MHRTISVLRSLRWSFLVGLALHALAPVVSAQGIEPKLPGFGQQPGFAPNPALQQPPAFAQQPNLIQPKADPRVAAPVAADSFVLVLPRDSTRQIEMSTKELITEFRSENPRVVKVQNLLDNPRAVLVTGIGPGSTRIFLTDIKKNSESLEVRVPLDDEADREAKRRELLEQIRKAVPTAAVDVLPSGNGTVVITGTVMYADSVQVIMELARGVFGPAANVVNGMRIGGVQQVQLEVTVARVNRSEARTIGFSFLNTGQNHFLASTVGGGGNLVANNAVSVLAPAATLAATPNAVFGIFNDKAGFVGYLQALRTEGLAKLMSEPRLITLSGRPAYFVSGGETPILTSAGQGSPTVTYKQFGTVVNFLPIVLGNGKIHLEVRPEISNLNAANGITIPSGVGTTSIPGFDLRSVQVAVQMEDGQTLAIGGLIQNTVNATQTKVPLLGDIPFLGTAFSTKTYTESEEELIILVTPHLVDPMACCQLPKYLPGRETRSPDDFELFLEGILEAPRGQRTLDGHHYRGAHTLNGSPYPCNDASGHYRNNSRNCGPTGCGPTGCGPTGCNTTYGPVNVGNGPVTNQIPAGSAIPVSSIEDVEARQYVEQVGNTVPAQSSLPEIHDQAPVAPMAPRNMPQGPISGPGTIPVIR